MTAERSIDARPEERAYAELLWQSYELAWDAWRDGRIDDLVAIWGPEIVIDLTHVKGWPEQDVYRGPDGARRFSQDWLAAWGDLQFTTAWLRVDGERSLARLHIQGRGRGSGAEVALDLWQIGVVRDGRPQLLDHYDNEADALAAYEDGGQP